MTIPKSDTQPKILRLIGYVPFVVGIPEMVAQPCSPPSQVQFEVLQEKDIPGGIPSTETKETESKV